IHVEGLCLEALEVGVVPEQVPQRGGDLTLGQDSRRALIQQRLEDMLSCPVNERDRAESSAQRPRGEDPGEATAHDYHPDRRIWLRHRAPRPPLSMQFRTGWSAGRI